MQTVTTAVRTTHRLLLDGIWQHHGGAGMLADAHQAMQLVLNRQPVIAEITITGRSKGVESSA